MVYIGLKTAILHMEIKCFLMLMFKFNKHKLVKADKVAIVLLYIVNISP